VKFYLGTHQPGWLWTTDVPLFISRRRLTGRNRDNLAPSLGSWALDSGGFTELSIHGKWETTPSEYVDDVSAFAERIGNLDFAAPQDWMCEPHMLAKTGKTVEEHQHLTVENFLELRRQAPSLPIVPALQGWKIDDYARCRQLYASAGVDLAAEPRVALGSVCRRQSTSEIGAIVASLSDLKLHGLGVKSAGLGLYGHHLASADSLAWSFGARRSDPLPGHQIRHKNCANCVTYAMRWRDQLLSHPVSLPVQPSLFDQVGAA
jgi:hypothetical protein